jgi:hypothetical protein
MIIVKLMGGLGNQMFQYAFGKALAIRNNTELKLDITFLQDRTFKENFTYRDFELDVFKIKAEIASARDIEEFKKISSGRIRNLIPLFLPFFRHHIYLREPHFQFFRRALNAPENTYADGYWQSEKYFQSVRKELLNEFAPAKALSADTIDFERQIKATNSVSIHVRRGDYVTNKHTNQYHGTCNDKYYFRAIKLISHKISNPEFFVFSDEPEWFKNNVHSDYPVNFVTHNAGSKAFEDNYLMSLCKHNIVANSSFSWWGAWLNQNQHKTVIAPEKWFNDSSKNTKDLLPETWLKI